MSRRPLSPDDALLSTILLSLRWGHTPSCNATARDFAHEINSTHVTSRSVGANHCRWTSIDNVCCLHVSTTALCPVPFKPLRLLLPPPPPPVVVVVGRSSCLPSSATPFQATPRSRSPTTNRHTPTVRLDDLRACFNMPIAAVAQKFGICATLLKKICRRYGIQRWPHRQIRSLQRSIGVLREALYDAKGAANSAHIASKIATFETALERLLHEPTAVATGLSREHIPILSGATRGRDTRTACLRSLRATLTSEIQTAVSEEERPRASQPQQQQQQQQRAWAAESRMTTATASASMSLQSILW